MFLPLLNNNNPAGQFSPILTTFLPSNPFSNNNDNNNSHIPVQQQQQQFLHYLQHQLIINHCKAAASIAATGASGPLPPPIFAPNYAALPPLSSPMSIQLQAQNLHEQQIKQQPLKSNSFCNGALTRQQYDDMLKLHLQHQQQQIMTSFYLQVGDFLHNTIISLFSLRSCFPGF